MDWLLRTDRSWLQAFGCNSQYPAAKWWYRWAIISTDQVILLWWLPVWILTLSLAKGRTDEKVRLLSDEGIRTISCDSTNRRDRAAAKHWDQFEKYMSKNLVDGITANSREPDEYGNVTVRYFERDERAIIFQLSNGVKQVIYQFLVLTQDFRWSMKLTIIYLL